MTDVNVYLMYVRNGDKYPINPILIKKAKYKNKITTNIENRVYEHLNLVIKNYLATTLKLNNIIRFIPLKKYTYSAEKNHRAISIYIYHDEKTYNTIHNDVSGYYKWPTGSVGASLENLSQLHGFNYDDDVWYADLLQPFGPYKYEYITDNPIVIDSPLYY